MKNLSTQTIEEFLVGKFLYKNKSAYFIKEYHITTEYFKILNIHGDSFALNLSGVLYYIKSNNENKELLNELIDLYPEYII